MGPSILGISKRKFPYPFKCALTLCSDIDSTDTLKEFLTIQEFLNTKNTTPLGIGLGLEIGNSFFPVRTGKKFALISDCPHDKEVILDLIHLGYIDSIHSFNTAKNRQEIRRIVDILVANNCRFDVWINHSNAPSNLGRRKEWLGDTKGSNHYHTDFSIKALGYHFIWTDCITSIVGQGSQLRLSSFLSSLDKNHLTLSLYNIAFKEICKYLLSRIWGKYSSRRLNDLIYPYCLNDGQYIFEFVRSDTFFRGIGPGANAEGLAHVLREDVLNRLKHVQGTMVVYTHLGKNTGYPYISEPTRKALRLLEMEYRKGNIFITTTSRLLKYHLNNKYLQWRVDVKQGKKNIHIENVSDPVRGSFQPSVEDLGGITFYTDQPERTNILVAGRNITQIVRNDNDFMNQKSIMIPFKPLPELDNKMKAYKRLGYF
jgi:hypothetical protein